jgi:AcrR family transcriptional regulator
MKAMSSQASAPALSPRRQRTRERLVEAATQIIGEKGFQAATLDEIAARAGLTKGAVYDNYDSKDQLFLAVVVEAARQRMDRFAWPQDRSGSVQARLRRLGQAVAADAPFAVKEAPLRAEFLLYTLTHEDLRRMVADQATARLKLVEARLLELFAPEELPLTPARFVLLIESLVPGLMFVRAQAPGLVSDQDIEAIFVALAGGG